METVPIQLRLGTCKPGGLEDGARDHSARRLGTSAGRCGCSPACAWPSLALGSGCFALDVLALTRRLDQPVSAMDLASPVLDKAEAAQAM